MHDWGEHHLAGNVGDLKASASTPVEDLFASVTTKELVERARNTISGLSDGSQRWTMRVPPTAYDPDLVFAVVLERLLGRRFGNWLETTGDLQRDFGVDWEELRSDPQQLADYITWNFTALVEEVGEMSHELPWAPWKAGRGIMTAEKREAALGEAVDALHFLANLLTALEVTDEELGEAYAAKQAINRARLGSGRSLPTPNGLGRSDTPAPHAHEFASDGLNPETEQHNGMTHHVYRCRCGEKKYSPCVC